MPAEFEKAIEQLAKNPPQLPLAVAFSGGADSTALLLACNKIFSGQVTAWHINHGLQAAAIDFENQCEQICERFNIPLKISRVDANPNAGESLENSARIARYGAIDELYENSKNSNCEIKTLLLAQHADDQVETLLIALSRGAGLAGLSAMPAKWQRGNLHCQRPLIDVGAKSIRNWLAKEGFIEGKDWIEDPSNQDTRFTRNLIRKKLLPVLDEVMPAFRQTFARSAKHAASARKIIDDIAQQDLQNLNNSLSIKELQKLGELGSDRQAATIRLWLKQKYKIAPSTAQLAELQKQIKACTTRGHKISIKIASGKITGTIKQSLIWNKE